MQCNDRNLKSAPFMVGCLNHLRFQSILCSCSVLNCAMYDVVWIPGRVEGAELQNAYFQLQSFCSRGL